ncbi:hypothetical protein [Streptomyces sp. NPDC093589]|uniref:hypothetical protein n=1 Tax=Streptomyces sp. NPDC093589 TaxID=3366043 RepID=UPI0038064D71
MTTAKDRYARAAAHALTEARAWKTVTMRATHDEELAEALAALDLTDLRGHLDAAALETNWQEARDEYERNSALARLQEVRLEAGVDLDARCRCGHNGPAHARRLVEGRLPCAASGCRCKDVALAAPDQ